MALGNGPKQDCACLNISPLLPVGFVKFYPGTLMHMKRVYLSHMEGQRSHGATLGRCILLTLFWTGGGANLPPPASFLNIAQKPLGLGS